jgi:hypothetical protein
MEALFKANRLLRGKIKQMEQMVYGRLQTQKFSSTSFKIWSFNLIKIYVFRPNNEDHWAAKIGWSFN